MLAFACIGGRATAQDKPKGDESAAKGSTQAAPRPPLTKQQLAAAARNGEGTEEKTENSQDKDSAELVRKREAWFYKQRASANGHIPSGAHQRAIQHVQRMLEAQGRLVHKADGSVAEALSVNPAVSFAGAWTSVGPTPTSGGFFAPVTGRITTIAVDPTDATGNTVLIGGAQGGIWRTTTAGASWTAVGDQNLSLSMGSIAFAPSAPATVYAGTGEQASIGADIYYGAGVLKSTNGGQTWAPTCTLPSASCPFIGPFSDASPFEFFTFGGARISYVAVNPTNSNLVLASAQFGLAGPLEGVYCSQDGGNNWILLSTASGEMSTFVGFASATEAYAALGDPFGSQTNKNGIYKSTNATSCSMTFALQSAATLPAASTVGRIDIGISPKYATDHTVYASIADASNGSSTNLGIWVTTNAGTSWTQTTAPDICPQQCWYDNVVKVDPNGGAHAFFGGSAIRANNGAPEWVQRTGDTGATWQTVIPFLNSGDPTVPHVDNHAMAFVPLGTGKIRMYLGNDGGIWRTDDAEAATVVWSNLNQSALTLSQFYPEIAVHPSTPSLATAGTQDNGSQLFTGSTNWADNQTCGDGTGAALDPVIPSNVYVACNGLNLNFSLTNGSPGSYTFSLNGIGAENSDFVPPLVTDPSTANRVYAGTTKVYQSIDDGNSWKALSSDLVNGASPIFDDLTAMAVAPRAPGVVYAGATNGQVFVATNVTAGAGTFAQVAGQASLPPRRVNGIAVDPNSVTGLTAYIAFSGFSFVGGSINDPKGHLFQTKDGGATWTDVSCTVADCSGALNVGDLPNTPVNDVVVDPDAPGTLYVATDVGVFQGGCTTTCSWALTGSGLPRVAVLSLKLHEPSRTLTAATHGRGVWQSTLANFTFTGPHVASLSQVSANVGDPLFTITITGSGLTAGTAEWTVGGTTTALATSSATATQVTATVPASLLAGSAVAQVSVKVATNNSNSLPFTVLGAAPISITSITPVSANVNAAATPVVVVGTGFNASSQVVMDPDIGGTPIPTTFTSSTQLSATVPAAFLANFGSTNSVGVRNPPPGGGTTVTTQTVTLPTFKVVAPAPTNDNLASAATVSVVGGTFTDTKDSSGATVQTGEVAPDVVNCVAPFTGNNNPGLFNTVWYKFTTGSGGSLEADSIGSSYDTVLATYTSSSPNSPTFGSLTPVPGACNDDIVPMIVTQSRVSFTAAAATTYFFQLGSFGNGDPNPIAFGGKAVFNVTFSGTTNNAPTITTLSPTFAAAGGAAFPLTVNGTNFVSGATVNFGANTPVTTFVSATQLTAAITAAEIATAATIGVTVTNPAGGGTSNSVSFTINAANTGTFTVTVPAAAQIITAGNTLMVPVTVTPAGGFTGGVTVNCTNLPPGVTCNGGAAFVINVTNANPAVGQLPIAVLGPSTVFTASAMPERNALPGAASKGLVIVGAGTGFAALFLLFLPGRKRLRAALGLGLVCVISLALGCGGGYGGGGTNNSTPTVSSITPTSATAGGPAFTLTVNGTNFVSGSVVNFGGSAKTATYASTTQLMAAITAADIANAGSVAVTVTNPGGGTSNSVNFTVNGAAVATTTKITLTPPAKVPTGPNDVFVFNVAVTGGATTPAGNIQLLDGGANLGTPTALAANGTLMITENGLIPAGTHAISALYKGDAGHLTSSSGAINCTVTGSTTVTIAAQGATNGNQTLNVTIN